MQCPWQKLETKRYNSPVCISLEHKFALYSYGAAYGLFYQFSTNEKLFNSTLTFRQPVTVVSYAIVQIMCGFAALAMLFAVGGALTTGPIVWDPVVKFLKRPRLCSKMIPLRDCLPLQPVLWLTLRSTPYTDHSY